MLPRVSLCRGFLFLLVVIFFLILVVSVHQRELWVPTIVTVDMTPGRATTPQMTSRGSLRSMEEGVVAKGINEKQTGANQVDQPVTSMGGGEETQPVQEEEGRPWYMSGGTRWPKPAPKSEKTGRHEARLWPQEEPGSDRITNQLMFVPPKSSGSEKLKKILSYSGLSLAFWEVKPGRDIFTQSRCPVDTCTITADKSDAADADAILFKDSVVNPGHIRQPRQVWILLFLESPYHTKQLKYKDVFNWTATYRRDSDVAVPYECWTYYDERVKQNTRLDQNYAANKTNKVAWFVSNCGARNNRLEYAHELQKHISVDIYGACGTNNCSRSNESKCFEILYRDYKFYLAFENSNCKDYITEKLFRNGLGHNVLPVVMGAPPEDYARYAPHRSYIHVDEFESPAELAAYLHRLDADDDLYNSYFRWKGTGEFINTYFFCRLCAMLHDDFPNKSYPDVEEWWRGPGICTGGSWRDAKAQ